MSRSVAGHQARKRFGQNFLHDRRVIERIVGAVAPAADDLLVEIGPGLGALTHLLADKLLHLHAVELDRDLAARLRAEFAVSGKLTLHEIDALRFDFSSLVTDARRLRVVGNLPYNISTPLIFHLLEHSACVRDMHFMLQKEVVERMAAQPGTSDYGRLSVMVQYYCEVSSLFHVGPGSFSPPPKVDSAVVRLAVRPPALPASDMRLFARVVTQAFGQRRKTIRNALRDTVTDAHFEQLGIVPDCRAEILAVPDFVRMANLLAEEGCVS